MQLISTLGSILAASAAIVPAGAVPCNQPTAPGGARQPPSTINVGAPRYPQGQNATLPVDSKSVEKPPLQSIPEGYGQPKSTKNRLAPVSSSTRPKCPRKSGSPNAPVNKAQSPPTAEVPTSDRPQPVADNASGPGQAKGKKPCVPRPQPGNTVVTTAPIQTELPKPVPVATNPKVNDGSPVNGGSAVPPKAVEKEEPTAPGPGPAVNAPSPGRDAPAAQPKDTGKNSGPKIDAAPPPPPAAPKPAEGQKGTEPSGKGQEISVTPHDKYSSSIGVLGCKINTDRVAYWPGAVGCDNICVKVSHQGRSLHLLKIDGSTGAHDISYDAWTMLVDGKGAKESKATGGGVPMTWEPADPSACSDLLHNGKLPLTAFNSMNYVGACSAGTWAGDNYELFNYADARCEFGPGDQCSVDLSKGNTPECQSSSAADMNAVKGPGIKDKAYGTGEEV
ncbi:hypothetical protein HIM_06717 [Hirsutella minnesotensis 3608]|uniref:Uncharacterized protein n=1 Tax=Hirsutella minnesotensis 3608 TaxID=1043627 RepID=A0A0F8A4M2_9HYPO|nr:hypothetical protein HIM_06717 [Hirsutella minnesotensis 3608]